MSHLRVIDTTQPSRESRLEELMGEMRSLITLAQVTVSGEHLVDSRDYVVSRMDLVCTALDQELFPDG